MKWENGEKINYKPFWKIVECNSSKISDRLTITFIFNVFSDKVEKKIYPEEDFDNELTYRMIGVLWRIKCNPIHRSNTGVKYQKQNPNIKDSFPTWWRWTYNHKIIKWLLNLSFHFRNLYFFLHRVLVLDPDLTVNILVYFILKLFNDIINNRRWALGLMLRK